jgi:saccharopine dehydrogenase-like NADP-dependent oxidoreductase
VFSGNFPGVIIDIYMIFCRTMSPFKSVLLVGASGRVGSAIQTELLAKKSSFSKIGVLTTLASAPDPEKDAYWASLAAQNVEILRVDFSDRNALVKTFKGTVPDPFALIWIRPPSQLPSS